MLDNLDCGFIVQLTVEQATSIQQVHFPIQLWCYKKDWKSDWLYCLDNRTTADGILVIGYRRVKYVKSNNYANLTSPIHKTHILMQ